MHYDMFAQNVDPNALDFFRVALQNWPALELVRPAIGEPAVIAGVWRPPRRASSGHRRLPGPVSSQYSSDYAQSNVDDGIADGLDGAGLTVLVLACAVKLLP